MTLELLSNGVLLDLFEYLDVINRFLAFRGLNARFDQLLFIKTQNYCLDFRSTSKRNFEIFCQQYLSSINDQVISFHLSDDVETPNLPQLFLSNGYYINQFIHLKSLVIDHTYSFDLLNQITSQCRHLTHLTHLSITIKNDQDPEDSFRDFINNIWSLSNITHCYLDLLYLYATWLLEMSVTSPSIKYLTTKNINYTADNLFHILKHTPHLQRLHIGSVSLFNAEHVSSIFPSLISLKTIVQHSLQYMRELFQTLPNLCYLTLEMKDNIYLDGQQWETILRNQFHNMKVFRLKMSIEFSPSQDLEEQVDQLLDSFRSDYWIKKHRWFVRCDWYPMDINKTVLLYTLPYTFHTFYHIDGRQSKSTSLNDVDYLSYEQVETLHHTDRRGELCPNRTLLPIRFANIRHLIIRFPFDESFWIFISTLDRLISLDVTLNQASGYSQLQTLLDRAPHLYSLGIEYLNNFSMTSFNIHSTSLRRLEFYQKFSFRPRYFNTADCAILVGTSIASQCEVLIINVENRTNILQLINNMPNLRALTICCKSDQKRQSESIETNNNLVEWLNNHLSSKHIYSSIIDRYSICYLTLWIHR